MILTNVHLAFWRAQQRPSWLSQLGRRPVEPTIHDCVNAHTGQPTDERDPRFIVHNLLNLLRSHRARGSLRQALNDIGQGGGRNPDKRAALARKWYTRIRERDIQRHPAECRHGHVGICHHCWAEEGV